MIGAGDVAVRQFIMKHYPRMVAERGRGRWLAITRDPAMPPGGAIEITNVVLTADMGLSGIDTAVVGARAYAVGSRKKFIKAVMRLGKKGVMLLYNTGSAVCTGNRNENDGAAAIHKAHFLLNRTMNINSMPHNISVVNVSGAGSLWPIDLEALMRAAVAAGVAVSWSPKIFPGLYLPLQPQNDSEKPIVLFFQMGRCIITGCKRRTDLESVYYSQVVPIAWQYRQQQ